MRALKSSSELHVYKHGPARACSRRLSGRVRLYYRWMGVSENRLGSEQIHGQMSNVKNIYRRCRMSRVQIRGAGGRRNVRPCRMQQRTVQFSDVP